MDRADLQNLADARVADAQVLMHAERWAAAYYLLGYAIECALKACAAKRFHEHEVPAKSLVNDFYTHQMDRLLGISDVEDALKSREAHDPRFRRNWEIVRDWSETARYNRSATEAQAHEMFAAVTDPSSGVLPWLKRYW